MNFEFDEPRRASRPLPAEGLKAKSQRGRFASRWYSNRLEADVEGQLIPRVQVTGKNYARRGQVLWFTLAPGKITADVQGSDPRAYRLEIAFNPIDVELAPVDIVHLEQGKITDTVQEKLDAAGVFTEPWIKYSSCTCPSWDDICKHAAAVLYLFVEQVEQEPAALVEARGNKLLTAEQTDSNKPAELTNAWAARPEIALRSAFSHVSDGTITANNDMEWLRQVYVRLTTTGPKNVE